MIFTMKLSSLLRGAAIAGVFFLFTAGVGAQIGTRFPSEKKVVPDPVTGVPLTFLTSRPVGDSKIYQTHPQWTADEQWLIFRSNRVPGEAIAVHEETGALVQVTEGGFIGMLVIAQKSMKLYYLHDSGRAPGERGWGLMGDGEIREVDLEKLFADSEAGTLSKADAYQRVVGVVPHASGAGGDMALDADEEVIYFRVGSGWAAEHLPPGVEPEPNFGPRNMGAGPTGLAKMHIATGEIEFVVAVPFQMGHVQTNPWVPGEIVFCWETGGNAPQRMWTVQGDGSGLRPLYPEPEYDWVTHEAIITPDEVAFAIMGHRGPGTVDDWGRAGTREKATGLAVINLRTHEMRIEGQTHFGSGLWHVHGSPDGRWAVGDDFSRSIYLIDRRTGEMMLLSTGHKETAADHPHPTFSRDGTRIQIQSAMLSEDNRAMNICIIPVPQEWLERTYNETAPPRR
jgi:oligogalacturonide lyase